MYLSELTEQASYSYALAHIDMSARDRDQLRKQGQHVPERLHFEFSDIKIGHTHVVEAPPPPQ